jgi:hypothetical protein
MVATSIRDRGPPLDLNEQTKAVEMKKMTVELVAPSTQELLLMLLISPLQSSGARQWGPTLVLSRLDCLRRVKQNGISNDPPPLWTCF